MKKRRAHDLACRSDINVDLACLQGRDIARWVSADQVCNQSSGTKSRAMFGQSHEGWDEDCPAEACRLSGVRIAAPIRSLHFL